MSSISHEAVAYSVQGFAGHAPNSLLVNNDPALNLYSLIGFVNFATDKYCQMVHLIKAHGWLFD